MEQGSPEWFKARLGKVTASRVSDVIAKTKSGYSTSRAKYMAQLLIERITGEPIESYTNPAMERGIEQEKFARAAYEAKANVLVDECGSVDHPTIPMSSASPDGYVEQDGLVEIKNRPVACTRDRHATAPTPRSRGPRRRQGDLERRHTHRPRGRGPCTDGT